MGKKYVGQVVSQGIKKYLTCFRLGVQPAHGAGGLHAGTGVSHCVYHAVAHAGQQIHSPCHSGALHSSAEPKAAALPPAAAGLSCGTVLCVSLPFLLNCGILLRHKIQSVLRLFVIHAEIPVGISAHIIDIALSEVVEERLDSQVIHQCLGKFLIFVQDSFDISAFVIPVPEPSLCFAVGRPLGVLKVKKTLSRVLERNCLPKERAAQHGIVPFIFLLFVVYKTIFHILSEAFVIVHKNVVYKHTNTKLTAFEVGSAHG